ncbi:TetR/AcrR family transcriptional regulator [Streptosporangium sp. NPDC002524]|uniref:TetR/AcrR family transcriptional regulator n=1 Tax=Streptosporangium sp. NPDC002524 TaxID=3154537 RepID=UPI003323EE56
MSTSLKATPRERLLRAAADLFYREGITATGVERLCRAAGVSKRSMYQLFETKDELVTESLALAGTDALTDYFPGEATGMAPREQIMYVFERLEAMAGDPAFRGCPFVGTATELKDPAHPAALVARAHKQELTDFFARQAALGGADDPETLADQLTVVFDGLAARAVVRGTGVGKLAVTTASVVLEAGGLRAG